jgi:hypothetical protein
VIVNRYPTQTPGRYAPAGYESAFLIVAIIEALAIVWTLFALPRAMKLKRAVTALA